MLRPRAPEISSAVTQAYQTVAARLTEAFILAPVPTDTNPANPVDSTSTEIVSTHTPTRQSFTPTLPQDQPRQTISPTTTPDCDRAAAGNPIDVTVPDETEFQPGQPFTKIWRLQNIGSCTWSPDYAAQFFYGNQMGASSIVFLGRQVAPSQLIEIAVDFVAPIEAGTYQGNWKMRNSDGYLFGIGPRGDAPFWVRIIVIRVATPTQTPTLTSTPTLTPTPRQTATPTLTPTMVIESSGDLVMQIAQTVDLDKGQTDPGSGQDLAYLLDAGYHRLVPQSNALLGVFGSIEPGLPACQAAGKSPAAIALESLSTGTYLCYLTDENRVGWLRFESLNVDDDSASFAFRTWANP